MADIGESSLIKSTNERPVIVRVKRKAFQSRLEAFWLEINERPLKRQVLDFEKLSISDSSGKEELKSKKVLVRHVETVGSSEATIEILQSFVPKPTDAFECKSKSEERKHTFKKENQKQDQLLLRAKQEQEVLAKNARFKQIWRSRKGNKEEMHHKVLHETCQLYDIVRVDVEETPKKMHKPESISLEDQKILANYLPLLRELIPSAAVEIESDMQVYMSEKGPEDEYVYDLYTVKDDMDTTDEDTSHPFPLVQVEEDDDFYDGPDESEYDSEDSNDENNPLNDYPDEEEEMSEDETENSEDSGEEDESEKESDESEPEYHFLTEEADMLDEDAIYGGIESGDDNDDNDDDGEDFRWSYR